MKKAVIDVHAHFTPPALVERFEAHAAGFPHVKLVAKEKAPALQFGADPARAIMPGLGDLVARLGWMDENAIDHQLVGGWVESFGYDLPARQGLAWSRFMNSCMREALRDEPRFSALATVPLQDGALAADVLEEALADGFAGVMIGTLPNGSGGNLDDAALDPFWETASRLGAAVVVHPMTFCGEPRLDDYGLMNAIGRVEDMSVALSRLLFSGHLLRFPGVKVVASMGGGALPYALGRLMKSYRNQKGKVADPAAGFQTLYFDSCVFDAEALEYLVRKATSKRVMLGSDAPFPMGDAAPRKLVDGSALSEAQQDDVLGLTAESVFRLAV
jgi:aminocarboxymuconate-semialdehyde decarboxylase